MHFVYAPCSWESAKSIKIIDKRLRIFIYSSKILAQLLYSLIIAIVFILQLEEFNCAINHLKALGKNHNFDGSYLIFLSCIYFDRLTDFD